MERDSSLKRRHILSSFNPEIHVEMRLHANSDSNDQSTGDHYNYSEKSSRKRRSESHDEKTQNDASMPSRGEGTGDNQDNSKPDYPPDTKAKKLKLKSKKSRSGRSHRNRDNDNDRDSRRRHCKSRSRSTSPTRDSDRRLRQSDNHRDRLRDRKRSHCSRQYRYRSSRKRPPTPDNPYEAPTLDPDAAFRESLFDALADDEGAAYWEGVYGQPMHIYSDARDMPIENERGELERMTDEEYAQWVREQMWAKTHQGLLEEKERRQKVREAERERQKEQKRRRQADKKLEREVEQRLCAGKERRARREKRNLWEKYLSSWGTWDGSLERIPWPRGQRPSEGDEGFVRLFFVEGLEDEDMHERAKHMKEERIRWHPDKIQQKLGGTVEPDIMQDVTMIFQIVDTLWTDAKNFQ